MPNFRHRLAPSQRRVYDRSNAVSTIPLRVTPRLARAVSLLPVALSGEYPSEAERRRKVNKVAQVVCDEICQAVRVSAPKVVVKGTRPIRDADEYHGLYVSEGHAHEITVWMYTAKRKQVVAPRTLLRTLLHEMVHHLDYTALKLEESFHTDGFFKRESSLVHQLDKAARKLAAQSVPAADRAASADSAGGVGRVSRPLALRSNRANDAG